MTSNEAKFADLVVNYDKKLMETRDYIKENFDVNSTYNEKEGRLNLSCSSINESLQLMAAKEYIESVFPNGSLLLNV